VGREKFGIKDSAQIPVVIPLYLQLAIRANLPNSYGMAPLEEGESFAEVSPGQEIDLRKAVAKTSIRSAWCQKCFQSFDSRKKLRIHQSEVHSY
jgi:hypothetical protein